MHSGRKILKSTAVVSVFTGLSRGLGLLRDMMMASIFGTTLASSAFTVAWRLPNLFRAVFGEGALSAAFIPVLTETQEKEGKAKADELASSIFMLIGSALILIVGVGVLLLILLGSLDLGERWNVTISLAATVLPYVLFICLAALCMGIFHTNGRFLVPTLSQCILNVIWIGVLLWIRPLFGASPMEQIHAVAWGVVVAGAVQLGFQSIFLWRMGFNPKPSFDFGKAQVGRFLKLMAPVFLGSGVTQLNVFLASILAMFAGAWAPASFGFAERLVYAALGISGTALGTVLLPTFSRQAASGKHDDLVATLNTFIRGIALVMTPIAATLCVLAVPCIRLIFQRGTFDNTSAILSARALMVLAPGLIVFSIYKVVLPAFYGLQDTKTPVRVGLCGTGIAFVMNILSVVYLPDGYQHMGLAASVVLSSLFATAALLFVLHKRMGGLNFVRTARSIVSTLVSGVIMSAAMLHLYRYMSSKWNVSGESGVLCQFAALATAITGGMVVYIAVRLIVNRGETVSAFRSLVAARRKG